MCHFIDKLRENKRWIIALSIPIIVVGSAYTYKKVKDSKDLNLMTMNSRNVYISAKNIANEMLENGFSAIDIKRVLAYPSVVSTDEVELYKYVEKYLNSIKNNIKLFNLTIDSTLSSDNYLESISYSNLKVNIIVNKFGSIIVKN